MVVQEKGKLGSLQRNLIKEGLQKRRHPNVRSGRNFLSQSLLRPPGSALKKDPIRLGAGLATT
ncbi:unnamed protein product [Prunus brigantina]